MNAGFNLFAAGFAAATSVALILLNAPIKIILIIIAFSLLNSVIYWWRNKNDN